jgi:hypothetical protein
MFHNQGDHLGGTHLMRTGRQLEENFDYPALPCVLAKELSRPGLPGYILFNRRKPEHTDRPAFLGNKYRPIVVAQTTPPENAAFEQLPGGEDLRQAILPAFDLGDETPETRTAYGSSTFGLQCLLARRLVERGVPVVEIDLSGWDLHSNATAISKNCTLLDRGWSTLPEDAQTLPRLRRTLIVWMGEFGRTARLNANGGRDHWPRGFTVVLAGRAIKTGQVIGQTSEAGDIILKRPVSPAELYATIYSALGIDPTRTNSGPKGVEIPLVEKGAKPIVELLP